MSARQNDVQSDHPSTALHLSPSALSIYLTYVSVWFFDTTSILPFKSVIKRFMF